MSRESWAFETASQTLESLTHLDRLKARGTIRLMLRRGGLDPGDVTREEMVRVVEHLLPKELSSRGIDDEEAVRSRVAMALSAAVAPEPESRRESPEMIFRRLAAR